MTGLSKGGAPPWRDGRHVAMSSVAHFRADLLSRVVASPPALAAELAARGLVCIRPSPALLGLLEDALSWIHWERELASILHAVVGEIHLLAADPGYDVSHSEPRWPRSVFVSIPDRSDEVGALRLAESVVHEAMHLHLTNRERVQRLVALEDGATRSPWRDEPRPYRGVLHGLYVFGCIAAFLRGLLSQRVLREGARVHAARRLDEIAQEVEGIDFTDLAVGLTDTGTMLMQECRRYATLRFRAPA